jgi:hypothetical protein
MFVNLRYWHRVKVSVYIFASVIAVIGFVMQDVVADTMSTEVVDKSDTGTGLRCTKLTPRIDNKGVNSAIIKSPDWVIVKPDSLRIIILAVVIIILCIIQHIKMEIDVVSDTDTVIGAVMMAVNPLIGLAIMDQWFLPHGSLLVETARKNRLSQKRGYHPSH